MKILYKKGDRRLLRVTNFRPLAITSILYKIKATVLQLRWKKVLPAAIAECQHGFVYKRRQFENVFKIRDAAHLADQVADMHYFDDNPDEPRSYCPELLVANMNINFDLGLYICDRDKAFDRVCHLWLVRALCRICGQNCEWRPTLQDL